MKLPPKRDSYIVFMNSYNTTLEQQSRRTKDDITVLSSVIKLTVSISLSRVLLFSRGILFIVNLAMSQYVILMFEQENNIILYFINF